MNLTVKLTCKQTRKIHTWLYCKWLKLLCYIKAINTETAISKAENYVINSIQFRINDGEWMSLR